MVGLLCRRLRADGVLDRVLRACGYRWIGGWGEGVGARRGWWCWYGGCADSSVSGAEVFGTASRGSGSGFVR